MDEAWQVATKPSEQLEIFTNPAPKRDYMIDISTREFTCLCPKTGQPDFAMIKLEYIPDVLCIELKALKLYLWSYRDKGAFHEAVTNEILDDIVIVIAPRFMRVSATFNIRGGLQTKVIAEHRMDGWTPSEIISAP